MRSFLIILPDDWHAALVAHARSRREHASQIVLRGIRSQLPREVRATLSTPRRRGRPPKGREARGHSE